MDQIESNHSKYLAKDRVITLRISLKEEAFLKNEAEKLSKSISYLIRQGFLKNGD